MDLRKIFYFMVILMSVLDVLAFGRKVHSATHAHVGMLAARAHA